MSLERAPGEPDLQRFLAVLRGESVDRVPNFENLVDDQHVTKLLGRYAGNTLAIGGDPLDQIVGADRSVRGIERFQHRAAQRRESFAPTHTAFLSSGECSWSAGGLIVRMGAIRMGMIVSHDPFLT